MKSKLIKDISSRTIQVIVNQLLGLIIFILLTRYLNKEHFGELNWSVSFLTFITTILSLRIEQIVVRNVAAGENASKMLTLYAGHTFITGLLFYFLLFLATLVSPEFFNRHNLLMVLALSHLFSFFSMPYKQIANGKENYGWLAFMSSVSTLLRAAGLLCIVYYGRLNITQIIWIYTLSSIVELAVSIYLIQWKLHVTISMQYTWKDYTLLIKESLPQIGMVIFNICIGRLDIILLGLLSTSLITAEYSFVYKIFELLPIPLLIIGPLLITRFSAYFSKNGLSSFQDRQQDLDFFIRMEMLLATFFPLMLNVVWSPLIDGFTQHKYGSVNAVTFLLLSICIPLQYLINFYWTIHFTLNRLALIFKLTAVTFLIIAIGDFAVIPFYHGEGAAAVYLLGIFVECMLYLYFSKFAAAKNALGSLLISVGISFISGWAAFHFAGAIITKLILAGSIYIVLMIAAKQLRKQDIQFIQHRAFTPNTR
ncbi:MAG: hypothetical protein RLZZ28_1839 [Bacteroidota bacterium]|jgi:O-antigen/teichoic acid export membrane protein